MKTILLLLLIVSVNFAFTQDYFVKKYPVDNVFSNAGIAFDSDSNIVLNYGRLISLSRKGKVNWSHFASGYEKIIAHPLGFCGVDSEIDFFDVNGDTIKRKRYNYGGYNTIVDIDVYDNGDLLLTALSPFDTPTAQNTRFVVLRLNSNLDIIWAKEIGDTISLQWTINCAVSGNSAYIVGKSSGKLSVMSLDGSGEIIWEKRLNILNTMGSSNTTNTVTDIEIFQGDIYIVGRNLGLEYFFVKITNTGQLGFVKYMKSLSFSSISLSKSSNSLLVYFNSTNSNTLTRRNQLINFDTNGDVIFAKYYEFEQSAYLRGVLFENDTIIYAYFVGKPVLDSLDYLWLAKTHVNEVVNCYEVENTDSIAFFDANYVVLPQSFTVQNAFTYEINLPYYVDTPTNIQDTTLCETFLPPKLPIEGDAILTIYPNPSNGAFQFQLTNLALEEGEEIELLVYEMNGKIVQQASFSTKTFILNKEEELANGMYICVIKLRNQEFIKKLVVE